MSAKKVGVTPRPYPFNLDLVVDPETIRKLDPWRVLEFFRREALLRSQRIQDLYTRQNERTLQREYGLKWKDLLKDRERWLDPDLPMFQAIWNLKQEVRDDPEILVAVEQQLFEEEDSRYLVIRIDTAVPPQRILQSLKRQLAYRHKRVIKEIQEPRLTFEEHRCIPPYHPRKRPPIKDFMTWAQYLDCYDLRITKALSYGEIAKKVYPLSGPKAHDQVEKAKARDRAEKAVVRVQNLIRAAERNNWPPPKL